MSTAIYCQTVSEVLLPDGWHHVAKGTFEIGPYEYDENAGYTVNGGAFKFRDPVSGCTIVVPWKSVLAVKCSSFVPDAS